MAKERACRKIGSVNWCRFDPGVAELRAYGGGWDAELRVTVRRVNGRSVATDVSHRGPLRLQKTLWPEGADPAHLILLHPPSGLAAGDRLDLGVSIDAQAHALVTTPGAGRWYRADAPATQQVHLSVGPRASLEWLPQETVLHDGVRGEQRLEWTIDPQSSVIGWEILVLGRRASGEPLRTADFRSELRLWRDGRCLLDDRAWVRGCEAGSAALGQRHVSATFWAIAPTAFVADDAEAIAGLIDGASRPSADEPFHATLGAASLIDPHCLLVRVVGDSPQAVRRVLETAWGALRPRVVQRVAHRPRIWFT